MKEMKRRKACTRRAHQSQLTRGVQVFGKVGSVIFILAVFGSFVLNTAARAEEAKNENATCAPSGALSLDASGKCPCGKSLDKCCHKDEIKAMQNDAVGELCDPANGKNLC